jgi:YVTN family beta-propeller protein
MKERHSLPILVAVIALLSAALGISDLQAQEGVLAVLPVGDQPVAVAINAVTNQAFVANKGSKDVAVIDLQTRTVISKYLIGGIPEGIAVNPKTNTVVVVGLEGMAYVIDQGAGRIDTSIPTGKAPSRVAIDVQSNTALVTNFSGSNMVVIDLGQRKIVKTIKLKNGPLGIAVLEGKRRAIVACQYDMLILSVNLEKNEVEKNLLVGRYISEAAVNNSTGMVAVTNPSGNGMVSVYDPATNSLAATIPVGTGPLNIDIYAKRNLAVLSEYNAGTVSLVDLSTSAVLRTITVGKWPFGIAVHQEKGLIVVANRLDGTVSFLDINALLNGPKPK